MAIRNRLLATSMLSGIVGSAFLNVPAVHAGGISDPPATVAPAVDGTNEKFDAFGGSIANMSVAGVQGSLAIPLNGPFGAQIDGTGGSLGGDGFEGVGGHVFWRNPTQGLVGLYGGYTNWDRFGGVNVSQFGGEGAYYWGPVTLEGVAGVETGNRVTTGTSVVPPVIPPPFPPPAGVSTTNAFNVQTRFFDQANVKYYINDDWSAYVGHRYLGGENAVAFGTELARPLGHGLMASLFVEGVAGKDNFHGVWGGLKLYFGRTDKELAARQRQDDPPAWDTGTLFSITNNQTSSAGSSSHQFCTVAGETPVNGNCVFAASDIRLKRDITLVARLANGIGLYRYRYVGGDTFYVGVMAQEVAAVIPEAVVCGADGYLRVNYPRLGLRLLTWADWQDSAASDATGLAA